MTTPPDPPPPTSGPTPRPWTANLDSDFGDYTIWGPRSNDDFIANIGTEPERDGIVAFDMAKANAELIVKAVNERAQVLAAVRDLMADPSWVVLHNHGWEVLKRWAEANAD